MIAAIRLAIRKAIGPRRDAEAIAEAATRPTMRFVDLKIETQLDIQTLHRARDRLGGERTALINQLRALLLERGSTVPRGRHKLEQHLVVQIKQMVPVPSSSSPPLKTGAQAASLVTAAPGCPLFRGYDAEAEGIKC